METACHENHLSHFNYATKKEKRKKTGDNFHEFTDHTNLNTLFERDVNKQRNL